MQRTQFAALRWIIFALAGGVSARKSAEEIFAEAVAVRREVDKKYSAAGAPKLRTDPENPRNHALVERYRRFHLDSKEEDEDIHERVDRFCNGSDKGCSATDRLILLKEEAKQRPKQSAAFSPDQLATWAQGRSHIEKSLPSPDGTDRCARIHVGSLSQEGFLREHAAASRPVLIEGAVDKWRALQHWSNLTYLEEQVGTENVRVFVVPYESLERSEVHARYEVVWHLDEDQLRVGVNLRAFNSSADMQGEGEAVVVRPAENEITFSEYVALARSLQRRKYSEQLATKKRRKKEKEENIGIVAYLQKHSLVRWPSLEGDMQPPVSNKIGKGLLIGPNTQMLWMATDSVQAPLHFDREDNLNVVIAGKKHFELYHPTQAPELYWRRDSPAIRSLHLLYSFELDKKGRKVMDGRGTFSQIPPQYGSADRQPFSPIAPDIGNLTRYPDFKAARKMTCEAQAGDVVFIPGNWWHQVTSVPDSETGVVASVTHFHTPYYEMAGDMHHFFRNSAYKRYWSQDGVPDASEFNGSLSQAEVARNAAIAARLQVPGSGPKPGPKAAGGPKPSAANTARKPRKQRKVKAVVKRRKLRKRRRQKGRKGKAGDEL